MRARPPTEGLARALLPLWVLGAALGCQAEPDSPPTSKQPAIEAAPEAQAAELMGPPAPEPSAQEAPAEGPRFVKVEIRRSIEQALVAATSQELGSPLSQVASRVIRWWIDLRRDLRPGDVLELVYSEHEGQEPEIHAIWFTSQKKGRHYSAVRAKIKGEGFPHWYDPSGVEVAPRLRRPAIEDYEQITALLGDGRHHKGVDFKAPVGTPLLATFTGVIRRKNWRTRGNGRCLELVDPKTGRRALYLHMDSAQVRRGQRVRVGQRIGRSGNTGHSFAPHLHFQLETRRGRVLDPLKALPTERRRVSKSALKQLRRELDRYDSLRKTAA